MLHLLVYLWYSSTMEPIFTTPKQNDLSREFSLVPPMEPPTPTEEINQQEPPAPRHIEDDPNKANASDGDVDQGSKTKSQKSTQSFGTNRDTSSSRQLINSTQGMNSIERTVDTSNEDKLSKIQSMETLDDEALDDSVVESPLTSLEEEKARWRNEVLKRISEQINFAWVKPYSSSPRHTGRLKLEIGGDGYLKNAWVHIPSGDPNLDASILRAVKSIWRFQIPNSKLMNRYYRHLELNYQGG